MREAIDEKLVSDWLKAKIKQELKSRKMTYPTLVRLLNGLGVAETEVNIRNKMSRGTFSAAFFILCLQAMGVKNLKIDLLNNLASDQSLSSLTKK